MTAIAVDPAATDPNVVVVEARSITLTPIEHKPIRLTRDMLRQMGGCSEYIRKFKDNFPEHRYPDGVEINQDTCVEHTYKFDWDWAKQRMLTPAGANEMDRLAASRDASTHERFGTGRTKRPAIFGYLIDQRPEFRSDLLKDAERWAAQHKDRVRVERVERARRKIHEADENIAHWTRVKQENEEALPELERQAAGALHRVAKANLDDALRVAQSRQAELERAQRTVDEKRAELERLAALAAAEVTEVTDATEPVTA